MKEYQPGQIDDPAFSFKRFQDQFNHNKGPCFHWTLVRQQEASLNPVIVHYPATESRQAVDAALAKGKSNSSGYYDDMELYYIPRAATYEYNTTLRTHGPAHPGTATDYHHCEH